MSVFHAFNKRVRWWSVLWENTQLFTKYLSMITENIRTCVWTDLMLKCFLFKALNTPMYKKGKTKLKKVITFKRGNKPFYYQLLMLIASYTKSAFKSQKKEAPTLTCHWRTMTSWHQCAVTGTEILIKEEWDQSVISPSKHLQLIWRIRAKVGKSTPE